MSLFSKDFQNRSGLKCNIVYTDYINDISIDNYLNTNTNNDYINCISLSGLIVISNNMYCNYLNDIFLTNLNKLQYLDISSSLAITQYNTSKLYYDGINLIALAPFTSNYIYGYMLNDIPIADYVTENKIQTIINKTLESPILNTPTLNSPILNTPTLNTPTLNSPTLNSPVLNDSTLTGNSNIEYATITDLTMTNASINTLFCYNSYFNDIKFNDSNGITKCNIISDGTIKNNGTFVTDTNFIFKNDLGTNLLNIGGAGVLSVSNNLNLNNGTIISNGILIKNTTTTFLNIDSNGVAIIPTINSYQFFNAQNPNATVLSTSKIFNAGVKCIHLSFSHATTTAGTFTLTFKLQTTAAVALYTATKTYNMSTVNIYQSQSFHFVTGNIATQAIVANYSVSGTGYNGGSGYLTCICYNLANNTN